ncbi:protein of unknown function [Cnuella takakiae]|uniref:eCIS core domain-containing protein n=1 Tax=Cnuella takakiae TaxID=1302690 RepID=A0A1M4ZEK0_9BACT|nr:DUF4157 domain-containing protein [Cnuella takakiae]OLY94233.1 hypothetical protein BUE76_21860 [Cnuella takakiae]SHF16450.1 protein of unknown function [Cnuella takakiae]
MKTAVAIPTTAGKKKSFVQKEKGEPFIRPLAKGGVRPVNREEGKADAFAEAIAAHPGVQAVFQRWAPPQAPKAAGPPATGEAPAGTPLPTPLLDVLEEAVGHDFSEVRLHADAESTAFSKALNAAAFTTGNHIFFNQNVFRPGTAEGLRLLAHELFHTVQQGASPGVVEVQLKPLSAPPEQTAPQKAALQRAVRIALGEKGKVNSGVLNDDKTRVGWSFLVAYFRTALGAEYLVPSGAGYQPGKLLEDVVKYVKKGKAQKVRLINGKHEVVTENNVDLLPSWCGIFVFWALHKAGIHPPRWELGKSNITPADAYKKGDYLPRAGDIVIKNGYNHFAMVVRTEPAEITDTKDLARLKVVTINGNTAGSNHQGGQIQEKTDPYSYWDFYVNPFFKGVTLEDEKTYQVDERLRGSLGEPATTTAAAPTLAPPPTGTQAYDTSLSPVGNLALPAGQVKKEEAPHAEEAKVDPKAILAKDPAFGALHQTLAHNATAQKAHAPAGQKAAEAQGSALSPPNERLGKAKAMKVQKLGALPPPKTFKGAELKAAILKEVKKLIDEKKKDAASTGDIPKVAEREVADLKKKNTEDIQAKKTESVGAVEATHSEPPNEAGVETRESTAPVPEDPGTAPKIPGTDKAVAKPLAEERLTLQADSDKIDQKMAEAEVDEAQLADSNEDHFVASVEEKRGSQAEAARLKEDYRTVEGKQLDKDKKTAYATIQTGVGGIHAVRQGEFGAIATAKDATKGADEAKRKEVSDKIEKIYGDAEKSVTEKLAALETTVNQEFDTLITTANDHFKDNVNKAMDDEFTWEWAAKKLDRDDYNQRVARIFNQESERYQKELSDALDPLTDKIATTLNSIVEEIQAAKKAVLVFVEGLDPALADIGVQSATAILEKFGTLEASVNQKQEALTNSLAKKYADGVLSLEDQFKKILDARKSWLEKALDAIIDAIKEILALLADLKKALERAADYGKRIIRAPLKFFNNLVKGATEGFNNFVKNIGKHLLQGALEWVTGEMGEAGIQLPEKFDFRGILSLILQVLGLSIQNLKEIARKVIGAKYVDMLEKGADLGIKAGDKILQVFTILKKDGLAGLWEFIKEQFSDMKEKLMEEARSFIVVTIVEVAVVKVVSMLIPGAGFISAVKSLIDFLRTLFAKARQIVSIITGIIDTFGEILAGNVGKVSGMVENVLAKFLGMAITFLAAILGLGKVGKKLNEIIQKKIKDPVNKALAKMMEKLKAVMTKLGIFKFLDKVDEKIQGGKKWAQDKASQVKAKATETLNKIKGFLGSLFNRYTDAGGETHTLRFKGTELYRESVSKTLGNYLLEVKKEIGALPNADERKTHNASVSKAFALHRKIVDLIGETVRQSGGGYVGRDKGFSPAEGEQLRAHLQAIAEILRTLPLSGKQKIIPKTRIAYLEGVADGINANASLLSLDSDEAGSQPAGANSPLSQAVIDTVLTKKDNHNLVRGHLINHELFGTGVGTKNLAPIPKRANGQMLRDFEKEAKSLVHANEITKLEVTMHYGAPNDKQYSGKSLLQRKLPAGAKLPVSVSYGLQQLAFSGTSAAKPQDINNPQKWKAQGLVKSGSIHIQHDDFF